MVFFDRVRCYIAEHRLLEQGERVVVAVSGGPDSLCLLHLLQRLAPALQLKLIVAHLNHRFRPEARAEAARVARTARRLGLTFIGAAVDVPACCFAGGLSAQVAARIVRYRFLLQTARRFRASAVAVGHHMDDQAETVLFHFLRGTGPEGLAGMLPRRPLGSVHLIRPLLCVTRTQIEAYCRRYRLEPSLDASNLEPIYTRNRMRLELIPHLKERYNPRLAEALFRLGAQAAADREYLRRQARHAFLQLAHREGAGRVILPVSGLLALPAALRGRVARLTLRTMIPARKAGWVQVRRLLDLCASSRPAAMSLPGGGMARFAYGRLVIVSSRKEPGEPPEPVILPVPGKVVLSWAGGWISAWPAFPDELDWPPPSVRAYLDRDLLPGPLLVRTRWRGARFYPLGAAGPKRLKKFLIDAKIPRERRDRLPLVTAGEEILWVAGIRIAHPYRVTPDTVRVLVLEVVFEGKQGQGAGKQKLIKRYGTALKCDDGQGP